jgi:hypothetical protein
MEQVVVTRAGSLLTVCASQVMDLIVNGPVKAGIRRARCEDLFDYFQSWKVKRLQAVINKTPLPHFNPPKPKVADGLRILFKVCDNTFKTESFQVHT